MQKRKWGQIKWMVKKVVSQIEKKKEISAILCDSGTSE
jgi:hypothetical protein